MKTVVTVFRKEMLDVLRDWRTLMMTVLAPLLFYPVAVVALAAVSAKQTTEVESRVLRVSVSAEEEGRLVTYLREETENAEFALVPEGADGQAHIEAGDADVFLGIAPGFETAIAAGQPGKLSLFYKGTQEGRSASHRVRGVVREFEKLLLAERLESNEIDPDLIDPLRVEEVDLATARERRAETLGGVFACFVIIFGLVGAMAPSVDLGAGEKERGTLETLMTAPANLLHIVAGKLLVVLVISVISTLLSLAGMGIILLTGMAAGGASAQLSEMSVSFGTLLLMFVVMVPLLVLVSAIMLTVSFFAKTPKQAHSMVSPFFMLVTMTLTIGTLPGFKFTTGTAAIPVLNTSLAVREVIGGTAEVLPLAMAMGINGLLAAVAIFWGSRIVQRESTLFRA